MGEIKNGVAMLAEDSNTHEQAKHVVLSKGDEGMLLLKYLQKRYPQLPRGLLEKGCRKGWIRLDGKRVKSARVLVEGENLRIPCFFEERLKRDTYESSEQDKKALQAMELKRTKNYIYFNKPAGLSMQAGSGVVRSMDGMLDGYEGERHSLRLVHRLDKDTSGVVAVARTLSAAREGSLLFAKGEVVKLYFALVWGVTEGGGTICDELDGKQAITLYKREWYSKEKGVSLLSLVPQTGRKHQLRVHLMNKAGGIVGDRRYSKNDSIKHKGQRLMLHNALLGLENGKWVTSVPDKTFTERLEQFGHSGSIRDIKKLWQEWQNEMFL